MDLRKIPVWAWPLAAGAATLLAALALMILLEPGRGAEPPRAGQVQVSGRADIGGPFELVRHDGVTVTEADFRGRPMLIYFGFTHCPDICPMSLVIMGDAMARLEPAARARIQPVLITLDPERDTPEQMALYVASPAFPEGLVGLTGTEEQVAAAARAWRVYFSRAGEGDDYLVDHTSIIYLMDSDGELASVFTHGTTPEALAEALQRFLEEERV